MPTYTTAELREHQQNAAAQLRFIAARPHHYTQIATKNFARKFSTSCLNAAGAAAAQAEATAARVAAAAAAAANAAASMAAVAAAKTSAAPTPPESNDRSHFSRRAGDATRRFRATATVLMANRRWANAQRGHNTQRRASAAGPFRSEKPSVGQASITAGRAKGRESLSARRHKNSGPPNPPCQPTNAKTDGNDDNDDNGDGDDDEDGDDDDDSKHPFGPAAVPASPVVVRPVRPSHRPRAPSAQRPKTLAKYPGLRQWSRHSDQHPIHAVLKTSLDSGVHSVIRRSMRR
jgi:hypothetical protein